MADKKRDANDEKLIQQIIESIRGMDHRSLLKLSEFISQLGEAGRQAVALDESEAGE